MSLLDRVTKAVGDVVDRGKKEVDQFVRIQKINGQIGDLEKSIADSKSQVQQIKTKIGEMAIDMLQAGTLSSPEMTALLDQIKGIQQQVGTCEAEISLKKSEIESIKAEAKPAAPPAPPVMDSTVPPPPAASMDVPPPPPPPAAARFCPNCGTRIAMGAFCTECGTKLA